MSRDHYRRRGRRMILANEGRRIEYQRATIFPDTLNHAYQHRYALSVLRKAARMLERDQRQWGGFHLLGYFLYRDDGFEGSMNWVLERWIGQDEVASEGAA